MPLPPEYRGYWTAGTPTPPDLLALGPEYKWWGDGGQWPLPNGNRLATRGLNFFSTLPVPKEVPAPASRGTNATATNGVGWDNASSEAWVPNPGTSAPEEPNMSPVPPDLTCIGWNFVNPQLWAPQQVGPPPGVDSANLPNKPIDINALPVDSTQVPPPPIGPGTAGPGTGGTGTGGTGTGGTVPDPGPSPEPGPGPSPEPGPDPDP